MISNAHLYGLKVSSESEPFIPEKESRKSHRSKKVKIRLFKDTFQVRSPFTLKTLQEKKEEEKSVKKKSEKRSGRYDDEVEEEKYERYKEEDPVESHKERKVERKENKSKVTGKMKEPEIKEGKSDVPEIEEQGKRGRPEEEVEHHESTEKEGKKVILKFPFISSMFPSLRILKTLKNHRNPSYYCNY